ncbi:MAG: glycosyltransferase, partial [Lachnospiraceae bacterium]|nr:glycosyltransferase [Lachnospiraceae bacterium]
LGAIICFLSFVYILITLIQTWIFGIVVPGYVTTLVVLLFLGGVIVLAIGILGEYIGQIYLESKNRPLYILEETNLDEDKNEKE